MDENGLLFCADARNLLRLEHIDALHQGSDDFRIQFLDLGVLFHLHEEGINVEPLYLGLGNDVPQFKHSGFEGLLLLLVSGSHSGKTLIADFTIEVVLVEPLDDFVQFADTLRGLLQFPCAIPQLPIEVFFILPGQHFHKFLLVVTDECEHTIYLHQQNLLHLHIVDLVGGTFSFLLSVGGTYEMLLLVCPSPCPDLVQFRTAVGAEQHSRQDRHFAHRRLSASAITDSLHNFKGLLVNNGFVGVLKNHPFGRVVIDLFL